MRAPTPSWLGTILSLNVRLGSLQGLLLALRRQIAEALLLPDIKMSQVEAQIELQLVVPTGFRNGGHQIHIRKQCKIGG